MVTAPTVRHTTATDMAVGTMGIIIGMAASLVVIMVVEVKIEKTGWHRRARTYELYMRSQNVVTM